MTNLTIVFLVITAIAGYLLGGLNGALIISKLFYHEDIRKKGSGNAGLTNFYRNYGALQTLPVLLIDVLKTVAACLIGYFLLKSAGLSETAKMLGGMCAVIGHMFPVYYGFHGGKGILSSASLAACMDWRCILILLAVFIVIVAITKYVSLGSILAAVVFPFTLLWFDFGNWYVFAMAAVTAVLAIVMHHANIGRLIHGTENKLKIHK